MKGNRRYENAGRALAELDPETRTALLARLDRAERELRAFLSAFDVEPGCSGVFVLTAVADAAARIRRHCRRHIRPASPEAAR